MADTSERLLVARYETTRRSKLGVRVVYCNGKRSWSEIHPHDGLPFDLQNRAASDKDLRLYRAAIRSRG